MRDIYIKGALYMRRIPILTTPWLGIRLHGIVLPDARQPLHNHPFRWWFSIVLSGGYLEIRRVRGGPASVCSYARGDRNCMIGPGTFHRIESVRPRTWTLFVHGKRITRWGFLLPGGVYVDADAYRDGESGFPK